MVGVRIETAIEAEEEDLVMDLEIALNHLIGLHLLTIGVRKLLQW
jgi:hypothetical protein